MGLTLHHPAQILLTQAIKISRKQCQMSTRPRPPSHFSLLTDVSSLQSADRRRQPANRRHWGSADNLRWPGRGLDLQPFVLDGHWQEPHRTVRSTRKYEENPDQR